MRLEVLDICIYILVTGITDDKTDILGLGKCNGFGTF